MESFTVDHKDMLGRTVSIGDVVCYATTIDNDIHIGTVERFGDCMMVVDGHMVKYDTKFLILDAMAKRIYKQLH